MNKTVGIQHPDKVLSYFQAEKGPLLIVTFTGIIYNIGMTAGPVFEGALVQRLFDISEGRKELRDMIWLCACYLVIILVVQGMRCLKRFYVRRFANDTSLHMRHIIYQSLVEKPIKEVARESVGTMMTKAVADVDACAEGMRKVTTEIFDTGVVMISYLILLIGLDWKLTILACCFTPFAYLAAQQMKRIVYRYNAAYKKSMGKLNDITMDRIGGAVTYRVYGREDNRDEAYDKCLTEYEKKAVMANLWENSLPPVYQLISMAGVVFIIWFGSRNVIGTGWTAWNIAVFTTYLSCFAKLAIKSAKAAKLFNAVQKATVSWKRIKPMMKEYADRRGKDEKHKELEKSSGSSARVNESCNHELELDRKERITLEFRNLGFAYPDAMPLFEHLFLTARSGEMIGITGSVACGKSTLGKLLLGEEKYQGEILINGKELATISEEERCRFLSYLGHQPELMSDTVKDNIALGDEKNITPYLDQVCLSQEVEEMPDGVNTWVGNGGIRLSGGQQARLALARTMYHAGDILILDDPFSALDQKTEAVVMQHLRTLASDKIILLISHRLKHFPELDQILMFSNHKIIVADHTTLMSDNEEYRELYLNQSTQQSRRKGESEDESER